MRWENLTVEQEEGRQLPGYRDPAIVRTFDAPEALDVRFYEVRAKSALNKVPAASRMPFRWTINPYRGCSHACVFCMGGETPVLMADGRTKQLADLRPGDAVYGTRREGHYRRFTITEVLDHWSSVKPAYRVTLEDGTQLVASGDHRFLTNRGWKHVTGSMGGAEQRPYLTTANKLMGCGAFAVGPVKDADYRRGYLCGMVRGDAYIGTHSCERADGSVRTSHRFRLALVDLEALRRARGYLAEIGVETMPSIFHVGGGTRKAMVAIRTSRRDSVSQIRDAIAWPLAPSEEWRKGFLAGIFDAEGSCSGAVRIANTDSVIVRWVQACLEHFGFDQVIDRTRNENGLVYVRFRGGLPERMRFFHTTDPAITRKRSIDGLALKGTARLRVAAVEPMGRALRLYDITTGTGDFIANGVVSHNCFARPTHKYLDFDAGRDFEREIVVKVNAPELVRAELARRSWKGEHVAMGTNTDPYQWVESRYKLMPGIWEAMRDFANPCSILTKSPLVLRDLELLREIGERTSVSANLSIPTLDEKAWRATEPHTPSPKARLEAVAELNRAGIPTGVLIAPLMPGINDAPAQVEKILELAAEAGATSIGGIHLHLRGEVRQVFFDWLRAHRPDLVLRYEELYRRGAYAPQAERDRVQRLLGRSPYRRGNLRGVERPAPQPAPRAEPEQRSLF